MTIEELALTIDAEIEVRYPDISQNYMFSLKNCEEKRGGVLATVTGRGKLPNVARIDYIRQIRGKRMVINAMGPDRKEFTVSETMTE